MAQAIIKWVAIRDGSTGAIKVVTHEVQPILYQTAGAKTASEGGVGIVNAGVHDTDAETLTNITLCAELVDLSKDVRRPRVGRVGLALELGRGIVLSRPADVQVGHGDQRDRPQLFNLVQCGNPVGCLIVGAIYLKGHASEDLGLEVDTLGDPRNTCFSFDLAQEVGGVLYRGQVKVLLQMLAMNGT